MPPAPAPPLPLDFVQAIQASQVIHPLYDHQINPTRTYFAAGSQTAWDKDGPVPVAVSATTPFAITLTPQGIVALNALTKPSLTAALGLNPLSAAKVFDHEIGVPVPALADALAKDLEKLTLVKPASNGKDRPIPWRIAGDLVWTLKGTKPQDPQYVCTTAVEIYALPPTLPTFYQSGIPLALLREPVFLPAWMQNDETDWPAFVVQAMFNDARWEYQSWNGRCRYVATPKNWLQHFANNGTMDCWLDLWLADLAGVRFDGTRLLVNTFDLAALSQVVGGLGLDIDTQTLLYYFEPFGFIKPTKLLGRVPDKDDPHYPDNMCNNPYYGMRSSYGGTWSSTMKCDDNDEGRSALRDHVVLAVIKDGKTRIFDVGLGPHLGVEDLDGYVAATIDTKTTLYNKPPGLFEVGGRTSVVDTIGVSQLVPSSATTTFPTSSLINRLEDRFQNDGTWSTPYITAPSGSADIIATWTFQPKVDVTELITVSIFTYRDRPAVRQAYENRRNSLPGWEDNIFHMQNDAVQGSMRVFYNDNEKGMNPMYLATIETRVGKAQSTLSLKQDLEAILDEQLAWTMARPKYIENVTVAPAGPVAVGQVLTITLGRTPKSKSWMGLTVYSPRPVSRLHIVRACPMK